MKDKRAQYNNIIAKTPNIKKNSFTNTHTHIYVYIYVCVCVYLQVGRKNEVDQIFSEDKARYSTIIYIQRH